MRLLMPAICLAVICTTACSSDASSTPTDLGISTTPDKPSSPTFSFATQGDRTGSASGISLTEYLPNGWSEESNGGATKYASDVTLMSFASLDLSAPQIGIGLLGKPRLGTYRVRVAGASFGAAPEYYGSYRSHNADGTSTVYTATSGSLTITAVSPMIRGTFAFHSSRAAVWPANVTVGMSVTSQPASLDASGSFVARAP